jgi:uncharacterized membrane protein SpoIIM required for sporulation
MASTQELKGETTVSHEASKNAMREKAMSLIKVLGIIIIIMGALPVFNYLLMVAYILRSAISNGRTPERLADLVAIIALSLVLPVAKLIGGYCLLKIRPWARKLTIAVFTIEYLIACAGAVLFGIQCVYFRNTVHDEAIAIATSRMLFTYIYALVALLFIALLARDSVRSAFAESAAGRRD